MDVQVSPALPLSAGTRATITTSIPLSVEQFVASMRFIDHNGIAFELRNSGEAIGLYDSEDGPFWEIETWSQTSDTFELVNVDKLGPTIQSITCRVE